MTTISDLCVASRSCHMRSHSVTCHPAHVNALRLKPRPDMQLVAVQLVACLGELYCLANKLLKVEHVQHCATCRQVRLFVAQTGNLLRRQVAHSVQTCNSLPATSRQHCMSGLGFNRPARRYALPVLDLPTRRDGRLKAELTWLVRTL